MLTKFNENDINGIIDLRYFSINNVCNQKLYDKPYNFLHQDALVKLIEASKIAKKLGYKLKIWDAYRPLKTQQFMFDFFSDNKNLQNFFSNPQTGSIPHCRGVAVDLTLCDPHNNEIDMGSDFDELSDLANHNSDKISLEQLKNRNILLSIMTLAGFDFYRMEWWHYQLFEARKYPVIEQS